MSNLAGWAVAIGYAIFLAGAIGLVVGLVERGLLQ